MQEKNNKRLWLVRMTFSAVVILIVLFLFIFFRGLAWSPDTSEKKSSELNTGSTKLIRQDGQRLWATRLSEIQRQELVKLTPFVTTGNGCAPEGICFVQPETSQQGVIIIYIEKKPDVLVSETPWIGGFINPVNGAVYDLLGRLYPNSTAAKDVKKFISYQN